MQKSSIEREWELAVQQDNLKLKQNAAEESVLANELVGLTFQPNESQSGEKFVHDEHHFSNRTGWLRAMVLGANDGLVSVGAIMLGISGASLLQNKSYDHISVTLGGISGLVAGAFSMACGEFVSVYSQRDTENADIAREKWELLHNPDKERAELVEAYQKKGLTQNTARVVADELMCTRTKALQAHLQEELHMDQEDLSNPVLAATVSAVAFSAGAAGPLVAAAVTKTAEAQILAVCLVSFVLLAIFGAIGAQLGGAAKFRAAIRVLIGGMLAMAATFGIGCAFGNSVG